MRGIGAIRFCCIVTKITWQWRMPEELGDVEVLVAIEIHRLLQNMIFVNSSSNDRIIKVI